MLMGGVRHRASHSGGSPTALLASCRDASIPAPSTTRMRPGATAKNSSAQLDKTRPGMSVKTVCDGRATAPRPRCMVHVHAKTALTEPVRPGVRQQSGWGEEWASSIPMAGGRERRPARYGTASRIGCRGPTVTYPLPVVAIVLGVLVLGESIIVAVLAGIPLVLAGVALTRRNAKPAGDEPRIE